MTHIHRLRNQKIPRCTSKRHRWDTLRAQRETKERTTVMLAKACRHCNVIRIVGVVEESI